MDKIASEAINAECGVGDPWTAYYGGDKREGQPDYAASANDGTLGGPLSDVLYDIEVIKKEAGIVGLDLNPQKSEVIVAIDAKTTMLKCLRGRLHCLTCHDAYLLLRHSLAIPKLLYLLRTSPCFLSPSLKFYDDEFRTTICSSFNIQLTESGPSWTQPTLPVHHGGSQNVHIGQMT
ncbi:hypothetical protein EMCRGX_G018384 [Ephydatia muelleri]